MEVGSSSLATKGSAGISAGGAFNVFTTGNITETIVNVPPAASARETLAVNGDINFNSALGSVNIDSGRVPLTPVGTGLLSSLAVTPSGISMKSLIAVSTFDMGGGGIDLKYLGGLATISMSAGVI